MREAVREGDGALSNSKVEVVPMRNNSQVEISLFTGFFVLMVASFATLVLLAF